MIGTAPFPISIDELSVEVVNEALGGGVASFQPTRIGADRGMLGEIFLLDLRYVDGANGPAQVVVKFAALREESLQSALRGRPHERELRCYDELLAQTPISSPKFYAAWYDPETAHFLLIQDSIETDPTVDQIKGIELHQARLVLAEAAQLHARWWGDPQLLSLDWLPRLDADQRRTNMTTIAGLGWQPLLEHIGDALPPTHRQALDSDLPDRIDDLLCNLARLPSTLLHTDLRADNLLFAPDGQSVALIDWQGASIGPPGIDLAYFMSQSLSIETRRRHEDELIEYYREQLESAGLALAIDEVLAGYAESMLYGLVIATALPVVGDPREPRVSALMHSMGSRSLAALSDHNQLWTESS